MKFYLYFYSQKSIISILLLFLFAINVNSNTEVFDLEMESICSKAEDHINSYFNEYMVDDNIKNYFPNEKLTENIEDILKMLFFDPDEKNSYFQKKFCFLKIFHIIFIILLILSILIIIIFEVHFMSKLYCQNENERNQKISVFSLAAISPFCLFKFFYLSEEKAKKYYNNYKNQKLCKLNKIFYIFVLIIILGLFISMLLLAVQNICQIPKANKALNNMSCVFSKFIYELDNTPLRNNDFAGLNKIYEFLSILKENSNNLDNHLKNFNKTYNFKLKNILQKWNTLLSQIDKNLSDQNSMEYFIETFPCEPICQEADCSNYTKHKYQLQLLYDYYPHNDSEKNDKILYKINKNLKQFYSKISKAVEDFDFKFINKKNQNISFDENNLYHKIIIKTKSIFTFYINEYSSIYFENIHNFFNTFLSFVSISIYLFLILLILAIGLSIAFIHYILSQSCMRNKFLLIIFLINIIFTILALSIFTSFKILQIKMKIIYIQDITRGIFFIFDKGNIDYFKGKSYLKINNIDINIYENETEINQIFYYLNNIINHNGIISNLYPLNEFNSSLEEILSISNKIQDLISNQKTTFNYSLLSKDINKYNKTINDFLVNGLQYNTNFRDINKTGYRGTGYEKPLTYLCTINNRIRKKDRKDLEFDDIYCDESWNISIFNYEWFKYVPREQVLCDSCINTCSNEGILLNYLEYSLEELLERYKILNDSSNNISTTVYNIIVFEFTALEEQRSEKIFDQVKKLNDMNSELMKLQNDLYNELKNTINFANEFIKLCKNIFNDYAKENSTRLYSFLDCNFIRDDLNFILSEVENNCLPELNNLYKNHISLNIISILFSFIYLIFYSITSYQPIKNEFEEQIKKILEDELEKRMRNKNVNGSKINLIESEHIQKNHVYNTIVFQNQKNEKDEKQSSVLHLVNNTLKEKSIKYNISNGIKNIHNSKRLL